MTLSMLGPSYVGSTDGDESCASTTEGDLFAEVCGEEKHASSRDEEVAAALRIL